MYKKSLVIATVFMTIGVPSSSSAFLYDVDAAFFTPLFRVHQVLAHCDLHNALRQGSLIENKITEQDGKKYLEITVSGIAQSEKAPSAMRKENNSISITTERGSFSVKQDNGTIKLEAEYKTENDNGRSTTTLSGKQYGKIQFSEVSGFDITSHGDGGSGTITLKLPLKPYETKTTSYAFEAEAKTAAAESAPAPDTAPTEK